MKKLLLIAPLALILIMGAACSQKPTAPPANLDINNPAASQNNPASNSPGGVANGTAVRLKLSDSPLAPNAYLISSDTLSAEAQTALTGFKLDKKTLADGTTQIDLTAIDPEYKNQQYILQPGWSLYFVDRSLGDDNGKESNIQDDFGIMTDSEGYIVPNSMGQR